MAELTEHNSMARTAGVRTLWLVCGFLCVVGTGVAAETETGPFGSLAPRFDAFAGYTAPGFAFSGYRYDGRDLFTGGGQMQLRYGRSRSIFELDATGDLGLLPTGAPDAWLLDYRTDPQRTTGFRFGFNFADIDQDFEGWEALGVGRELGGIKRQDLSAGWSQGQLAFDFGRDRLRDKETNTGFSRDLLKLSAYGFSYHREGFDIDADARFGSDLTRHLVGAKGYDLGKRALGTAKGGFTSLDDLAGLQDRYEAFGFDQGDLSLGMSERRLTQDGASLLDRQQRFKLGDFQVTRSTKALDEDFEIYRQAGYGDWRGLQSSREDSTQALLKLDLFSAGWTNTKLRKAPKDRPEQAVLTESTEQKLLLTPSRNLSFSYRQFDSTSGKEADWLSGERDKLTSTRDTRYQFGLDFRPHKMTITRRDFGATAAAVRRDGWENSLVYSLGKRGRLEYVEQSERTTREKKGEAEESVVRMQRIAAETAFGLSALHERVSQTDEEASKHQRVRFDRTFGPRYEVAVGYETWANSSDSKFGLAGYDGVLKKTVAEAEGWDWRVAVRPGDTEISAWQRSLTWSQPKGSKEFEEGEHRLLETGAQVAQKVFDDFRVRGQWSRYARDAKTDLERREVCFGFAPATGTVLLPSAEIGYRELRNSEGEVSLALFATAKLKPASALEFQAGLAQAQAGAGAVADEWFEAERQSVQLSATQSLGKDGSARVLYTEEPVKTRNAAAPVVRAQEWTIGFKTPSNWASGFSLSGNYHTRYLPSEIETQVERVEEHQAALSWAPDEYHNLMASYSLSSRMQGASRDGATRLEFQYTQKMADAQLAVTGFLHDAFDLDARAEERERERYRFGFNYTMPF